MAWMKRPRSVTIDPPLQNGWTGSVQLTREGNTVWMRVEALAGASSTATGAALIPLGYRPVGPLNERGLLHQADVGAPGIRRWWAQQVLQIAGGTSATPLYGSASWRTTDPMPTGGA